jgi:hypothetical protein
MMNLPRTVYLCTVQGLVDADLLRSRLDASGIGAVARSNVVQSIHPFTVNGLGAVKIYVHPEDLDEARKILFTSNLPYYLDS